MESRGLINKFNTAFRSVLYQEKTKTTTTAYMEISGEGNDQYDYFELTPHPHL